MAADFVSNRDKARKELFESIDVFCQEVNLIPLQEREKSLQVQWDPAERMILLNESKNS